MRKLTYFVAVTIDGFIAGPDGGDPSPPNGFFTVNEDYLAELVENYPETLPGPARDALGVTAEGERFDTVLEGRRAYELGLAVGLTNAYPHLRHLVFSRTLGESPDPTIELVASDPVEKVRELKQQAGKGIWLVGGAALAGSLFGEIDELVVKLNPIAIGTGIPIFGRDLAFDVTHFRLADHKVLPGGTVFLTYARTETA